MQKTKAILSNFAINTHTIFTKQLKYKPAVANWWSTDNQWSMEEF